MWVMIRVTIRPHFPGNVLIFKSYISGILKIDANVRKLDLSILIFTLERRQEQRKYCNRKKFRLRLFMDFYSILISRFKKMF